MSAVFSLRRCCRCNEPRLVSEFGRRRGVPMAACKRCEAQRAVVYRLVSGTHAEAVAVRTHGEVAAEMGLSVEAVKKAEASGLRKMRAAMREWR